GHDVGDEVLKMIANSLAGAIRQGDFAARFGGEEFAVLLKVGKPENGYQMAERLRKELSGFHQVSGNQITVTVSVGGVSLPSTKFDFQQVLRQADSALYAAKRLGRNCAVFL